MNTRGKNNIWSLYLAQYLWFPNTLKAYSCLLCSFTCVDSFFIMICQSPIVHTVPQQYSLSFFNWCPGGCCHIITIFRCSSNLLRWCVVFQQYDFFFKFCLFSGREICCHLWQLDKDRLQSHFTLSILYLGSIMNKQHSRWLTSKKCFLSSFCQDWKVGEKLFNWDFKILFLKSELWFFFFP